MSAAIIELQLHSICYCLATDVCSTCSGTVLIIQQLTVVVVLQFSVFVY